jgi:rubrerythrin
MKLTKQQKRERYEQTQSYRNKIARQEKARAAEEVRLTNKLLNKGWKQTQKGFRLGNKASMSLQEAVAVQRKLELKEKAELLNRMESYLIENGWTKEQYKMIVGREYVGRNFETGYRMFAPVFVTRDSWKRPHWAKEAEEVESQFYSASLKNACSQQLKIDLASN